MAFDLEAMRNNFYQYRNDGYKKVTIYTKEKLENKKDVIALGKDYGLKVKIRRKKQYGTVYKTKTR